MPDSARQSGSRIAVFSRYNLAEQVDLAAEFRGMLEHLAARNSVLHLSLRGPRTLDSVPPGVHVVELPVLIDRSSHQSIIRQSAAMYTHLPAAARHLNAFRPDLVFLSEILPLAGWYFKKKCRTRVATAYGDWHVHNMLAGKWWSPPFLQITEWLDRMEVRRLDGFFCRAGAAGDRVQRWGHAPEAVRVVRDAPDPAAFYPRDASALRRKLGFSDDDTVLLYHGIMHAGKGLDRLIHWCDDLYAEEPGLGLILVGGGPEETALRKQAEHTAMAERIRFTGWLSTIREVGEYCCAADLCIAMRTRAEANDRIVPGALLHSMACRKVVLAPRLNGIAEILQHGENGYMFTPDDDEDFKRLLRELIQQRQDWPRVAENAWCDIQNHYSVEAAARQYAEALEHFAHLKPKETAS